MSPATSKNKNKERIRKRHVGQRGFHITHHKLKGTGRETKGNTGRAVYRKSGCEKREDCIRKVPAMSH